MPLLPPGVSGGGRHSHHADRRSQAALSSPPHPTPGINPHTLSAHAQRALASARNEAVRLGHDSMSAEHIVLGLIRDGGTADDLFTTLGLSSAEIQKRLEASGQRSK